jgi:hypothetical protein
MNGWFADGVIFDSDHFSTQLLDAEDLTWGTGVAQTAGNQLRLRGTVDAGTIEVWLDAEPPHLFRRGRFDAGAGLLADLNDLDGVSIEVEVTSYTRIGDKFYPEEAIALYQFDHTNETTLLEKLVTTKRLDTTENPDFEAMGAFQLGFVNGAVIKSYDKPYLTYLWEDDELYPHLAIDMEQEVNQLVRDVGAQIEAATPIVDAVPDPPAVPLEFPINQPDIAASSWLARLLISAVIGTIVLAAIALGYIRRGR